MHGRYSLFKTISSSTLFKHLVKYLKPELLYIFFAAIAMVLVAASEAGIPMLLKPLVDKGFRSADAKSYHWFIPLIVIFLALVRGISQYGANYLLSYATNNILFSLRYDMFKRLLFLPVSYFQQESASSLINVIVFEVNQVLVIFSGILITLVRDSMTVFFLLFWLFYIDWKLTLIIVLILPVISLIVKKVNKRLRNLNREFQSRTNALSYLVSEIIRGYKVVKIHNGEVYELERFRFIADHLRSYAMKMTVTGGLSQPITQLMASVAFAIVLVIAMVQSANDQSTVGDFISYVTAMLLIISPIKHLLDINQPLLRGTAAAEMIFNLMNAPIEEDMGQIACSDISGRIEFKNVYFSYPFSSRLAISGVSLVAFPGEMVALVGPSGSGKSTMVNLLAGFFHADRGEILVDGVLIQEYRLSEFRHQLSFVSQDIVLFNASLADNIVYGEVYDADRLQHVLRAAFLEEMVNALPDGLDTIIGDNGTVLSGGQRQRLAIARAIYKNAPILILDEATSSLDAESERHIQKALKTLMEGKTTIVVAHRLTTIEKADQIFVFDGGSIVESGKHANLIDSGGLYAKLYASLKVNQITNTIHI